MALEKLKNSGTIYRLNSSRFVANICLIHSKENGQTYRQGKTLIIVHSSRKQQLLACSTQICHLDQKAR